MSINRLRLRVTVESALIVAALALVATMLGGARAGLGVVAGGALAVASFWRLAGDAAGASVSGTPSGRWLIASAVRFGALAVALGGLLALDWAHPVAVVLGLTILPCDLVAQGLRLARAREDD